MEAQPITQERYNSLVNVCERKRNENISLTDENEHLKEQAHDLSLGLVKYMNMVLRMVIVMNKNGLKSEVNDIINP